MRRLLLAGAVLAALVAAVMIWRAPREVAAPAPAATEASPPLPARVADATARPPVLPERTAKAATPRAVEPAPTTATNEARFKALHQALESTTPDAARLYADLAKAGIATPPQARTLVAMKQQGTPHDELVAYVRTSFPNDVIARAVALRWLDAGAGPHASPATQPPRPLGNLLKRDAN
jgi:hypothetical protein